MLTLIEIIPGSKTKKRSGLFRCDCGGTTIARLCDVKNGKHNSCSCRLKNKKHCKSGHYMYTTWMNIKGRCYNSNNKAYENYGGRGIKVCDRWLGEEGFNNFFQDMGERPGKGYSIDRIDNDGDYSPENCRWATAKEQGNNRRNNVLLEYNGKIQTLGQWAEELNLPRHALKKSSVEEALSKRDNIKKPKVKTVKLKFKKPRTGCCFLLEEKSLKGRCYSYYCNEKIEYEEYLLCQQHYDYLLKLEALEGFKKHQVEYILHMENSRQKFLHNIPTKLE